MVLLLRCWHRRCRTAWHVLQQRWLLYSRISCSCC
jgi:hypothetical protein